MCVCVCVCAHLEKGIVFSPAKRFAEVTEADKENSGEAGQPEAIHE